MFNKGNISFVKAERTITIKYNNCDKKSLTLYVF
nr:MAG TPA: hypothetical protein [Caudoviricetes sp.]